MLTNEQYAEFIQQGNTELKPILWDKVKKFLFMLSDKFYNSNTALCTRYGIESEDIRQQCYFAYENALKGYDTGRGTFITYLTYTFKTSLRDLFPRNDTLDRHDLIRLDYTDNTEADRSPVSDRVPDADALEPFELVERYGIYDVVHHAVDTLPEKQRDAVTGAYFDGSTLSAMAKAAGVSKQCVSDRLKDGLKRLKHNTELIRLADEYGYTSSNAMSNSLTVFYRTGMTGVERVALERAHISIRIRGK